MTALPKTVPYLYALGRESDSRIEFAEEAARLLELYAKLRHSERNTAMTVLEALTLVSRESGQ